MSANSSAKNAIVGYTPGPWKVAGPVGAAIWITDESANNQIAMVYGPSQTAEGYGNARLIAAATELYAVVGEFLALRQAVIDVGGTKGPLDQQMIEKFAEMQCGVVDRAEAVLRKARGEHHV